MSIGTAFATKMAGDIRIFMLVVNGRWRVILRHVSGREEISEQSWATREECERAIEQYAKDRDAEIRRVQ